MQNLPLWGSCCWKRTVWKLIRNGSGWYTEWKQKNIVVSCHTKKQNENIFWNDQVVTLRRKSNRKQLTQQKLFCSVLLLLHSTKCHCSDNFQLFSTKANTHVPSRLIAANRKFQTREYKKLKIRRIDFNINSSFARFPDKLCHQSLWNSCNVHLFASKFARNLWLSWKQLHWPIEGQT